jgi:hypothetical protein
MRMLLIIINCYMVRVVSSDCNWSQPFDWTKIFSRNYYSSSPITKIIAPTRQPSADYTLQFYSCDSQVGYGPRGPMTIRSDDTAALTNIQCPKGAYLTDILSFNNGGLVDFPSIWGYCQYPLDFEIVGVPSDHYDMTDAVRRDANNLIQGGAWAHLGTGQTVSCPATETINGVVYTDWVAIGMDQWNTNPRQFSLICYPTQAKAFDRDSNGCAIDSNFPGGSAPNYDTCRGSLINSQSARWSTM